MEPNKEDPSQLLRSSSQINASRPQDLAHVNRCPEQVLLDIFDFLIYRIADSKEAAPKHPNRAFQDFDIISVSQVCHGWRKTAVCTPGLWMEIPVYSKKQLLLFAERSRDAPIKLFVDDFPLGEELEGVSDAIVPLIPRLRAFHLRAHSSRDIVWWIRKLVDPAPILEVLSLEVSLNDYGDYVPAIFGGSVPSLRALTLYRIRCAPESPLVHNLLHLRLYSDYTKNSLGQLGVLRVLQRCPDLETLVIANHYPEPSDPLWIEDEAGVDALDAICLPRLSCLQLGNVSVEFPHAILRHLVLPAAVKLEFDTFCRGRALDNRVLQLYRDPRTSPPALSGVRSLHAAIEGPSARPGHERCTLSLRGSRSDEGALAPVPLRVRHTHNRPRGFVVDPRLFLDVSAVERYTIDFVRVALTWAPRWWQHALADMHALRTLTLRVQTEPGTFQGLLDGLVAAVPDEEDDEGEGEAAPLMLCPSLERLVLEGVELTEVLCESLLRVVKDRRAVAGSPFRSVWVLTPAATKVDIVHPAVEEVRALLEDFRITPAGDPAKAASIV